MHIPGAVFCLQLSQQTSLLQELNTADRESLLAEIRQLRATINAMRDEQRIQVTFRSSLLAACAIEKANQRKRVCSNKNNGRVLSLVCYF